jgi:hypothetical protein
MDAAMRFPKRTIVLMILAMLSFVWMYWQTHRSAPQSATDEQAQPAKAQPVEIIP